MNKYFLMASILLFSTHIFAKSLDCKIFQGINENEQKLSQTSFAENDPEEESEVYEITYQEKIKAYVSYLPYQDGVDLYLELINHETPIQVETNFDLAEDAYMNLGLKLGNTKYTLACERLL